MGRTLLDPEINTRRIVEIDEHPYLSAIRELRNKRKFAELILFAWSIIEYDIDDILTHTFGLSAADERAELLLDLPFGRKLEFLKKMKVITATEFSKIHAFQSSRNALVHHQGKDILRLLITEKEESERYKTMDNAVSAAEITFQVAIRCGLDRSYTSLDVDSVKP